jgi:sugar/nucleoside kinase (ribokinase family)
VDSCGAGDTFHGAYAWAVASGLPPAECFDTAAWSAALKVSRLGNKGIPTLDQLESARDSSSAGKRVSAAAGPAPTRVRRADAAP